MSNYKRIKRLAKSFLPSLSKDRGPAYSWDDAKMVINSLGMQMSPELLDRLVNDDTILDDFGRRLYQLERKYGRKVVTEQYEIDPELTPRVYDEGDVVGFSVTRRGKELLFAEYDLT